eukprot:jgi/Bigna1/129110/aug1.8_g3818
MVNISCFLYCVHRDVAAFIFSKADPSINTAEFLCRCAFNLPAPVYEPVRRTQVRKGFTFNFDQKLTSAIKVCSPMHVCKIPTARVQQSAVCGEHKGKEVENGRKGDDNSKQHAETDKEARDLVVG